MHGVKQNQPSQEFVTRVKLVALGALEGSRQVTVVTDGRGLLLSHRCEAVCSSGIQDKGSRICQKPKSPFPPNLQQTQLESRQHSACAPSTPSNRGKSRNDAEFHLLQSLFPAVFRADHRSNQGC